jgi:hypothetical protein
MYLSSVLSLTYSCILFAVYPTDVFRIYRLQACPFFTQSGFLKLVQLS